MGTMKDSRGINPSDPGASSRLTERLKETNQATWSAVTGHPFVKHLGTGDLREEVFAEYLVQDYAFLDGLISGFGFAVGQAPGQSERRPLVEFLELLTAEEYDYFERAFDALEISQSRRSDPTLAEPTETFLELLVAATRTGDYAESLAVLVPAEWVYLEWASSLGNGLNGSADGEPSLPWYYEEWIEMHASTSFATFVETLRHQLDTLGAELSPRRRNRVERLFGRTVDLELAFFDRHLPGTDQ